MGVTRVVKQRMGMTGLVIWILQTLHFFKSLIAHLQHHAVTPNLPNQSKHVTMATLLTSMAATQHAISNKAGKLPLTQTKCKQTWLLSVETHTLLLIMRYVTMGTRRVTMDAETTVCCLRLGFYVRVQLVRIVNRNVKMEWR